MSDALAKVKRELGKDAVILHTRTLKRGGVLGIGTRSLVEITATADDKAIAFRKIASVKSPPLDKGRVWVDKSPPLDKGRAREGLSQPGPQFNPPQSPLVEGGSRTSQTRAKAAGVQSAGREEKAAPAPRGDAVDPALRRDSVDPALRREVIEIRTMVQDLLERSERAEHPEAPAELLDQYMRLIGQEVGEALALRLLHRVAGKLCGGRTTPRDAKGRFVRNDDVSDEKVQAELRRAIVELLPPASPLKLDAAGRPTVVAMVGPTGVGKTTTIAKLAANMKLRENKKVGLITIDSYRIAAVEQLKTYARILKVPLVAVLTPDEMRSAVEGMSDLDLILIDTAGRSQRDELRIAELRQFLEAAVPDQVHLVLSTTSREAMLRESVEKFAALGAEHLIFTKLDEAVGFGVILNVLETVNLRLSYLTHGQSVPDDIEIGSASRVANLILGGTAGGGSARTGEDCGSLGSAGATGSLLPVSARAGKPPVAPKVNHYPGKLAGRGGERT